MHQHRLLILFFICIATLVRAEKGYYRFPALYNNTVVFTAEGDLWKTDLQSGVTQRLTTHHGLETNAAISPDGQWIAFSGNYEGVQEVYVMLMNGGLPKRVTYDGEAATVTGWTADGRVLYTTRHYSTLPNNQLVIVDPASLEHELVPLAQASDGSYGPDGAIYFTRLPFQGSHTRRYQGGTAQNIWKLEPKPREAVPLTADYAGTSKTPMWYNGRIYFASDRDGTMNIWSMNAAGKDLKQHSKASGWDLQSPALHQGRIVYQRGADLYLFDIAAGKEQQLDIQLVSDFDQRRKRWIDDPVKQLSNADISQEGDKVAVTARGRVFVKPAEGAGLNSSVKL